MHLGECTLRALLLACDASRSCDWLTLTSCNCSGCIVVHVAIIFIGAWGLIGKWRQSNEAVLSGYLMYLLPPRPSPHHHGPSLLSLLLLCGHEFTSLGLLLQKPTQIQKNKSSPHANEKSGQLSFSLNVLVNIIKVILQTA